MKAFTKGYLSMILVFISFMLMDITTLLKGDTLSKYSMIINIALAALTGIGIGLDERSS